MERPTAETIAYYDAAVPADPRARKGVMFAHPAAFVNGNMFFGTFHQTVIVRLGEARAAELAKGKVRVFEPRPGRVWKEYVQVDAGALPKARLAALAAEALDWTDALPPKAAKGGTRVVTVKKARTATKAAVKAAPAKKAVANTAAAKKPAAKKAPAKKPAAKAGKRR